MQAGKLRHVVELQRQSGTTLDSHGDTVPIWVTLATVRACVWPLSGREFVAALTAQAELTTRIEIRARADLALTPKDRVKWGSRLFDIRHIVDIGGRGREWHLLCTGRFS